MGQSISLLRLGREHARKVFANRGSLEVIQELQEELADNLVSESEFDDHGLEVVQNSIAGQRLFEVDGKAVNFIRPDLVPHFRDALQQLSEGANIGWLVDVYAKAADSGEAIMIVREV